MAHHVLPQKIYIFIFITLLLLTGVTVEVAFFNFGWLNLYIALTIATTKATLVLLYFMHLRYSERINMVFIGAGVFWLLIMIALTLSDIFTRGWEPNPEGWSSLIMPLGWW